MSAIRCSRCGKSLSGYLDPSFRLNSILICLFSPLKMLRHVSRSRPTSDSDLSEFVLSLTRLQKSRILGSTAGVLPIGPAGMRVFPSLQVNLPPATLLVPNKASSTNYSTYALSQQGIWANVSCQYIDSEDSPMTLMRQQNGTVVTTVRCTDGTEPLKPPQPVIFSDNGLLVGASCRDASNEAYTIHFRSFWSTNDAIVMPLNETGQVSASTPTSTGSIPTSSGLGGYTIPTSGRLGGYTIPSSQTPTSSPLVKRQESNTASAAVVSPTFTTQGVSAYGGIDAIRCTLSPRIRDIRATHRTDLGAFVMNPQGEAIVANPTVTKRIMEWTMNVILEAQTLFAGNIMAEMVNAVGSSYYHLNGVSKHEEFPALLASMIKGVYEYEVSPLHFF